MPWMLSCIIMARLSVGSCNNIVWDTKEIMTKIQKKIKKGRWNFSHNPPTSELIFCLLQTYVYCVYCPHVHAIMHDSNMIEVSIIHIHSPSTYFPPYVLLCCSVSHYSPQLILSVSAKVQFKKIVLRKSRGSTSNLLSIIQICVSELQPPMTGWRDLHSRMDQ